jgi:tetratricopeptide (TPR) repeat protein
MRIIYLIYVILFILFARPLLAANTQPPPKFSLSFDEYRYQRALYAFLTGDHITLSKLTTYLAEASSKEKNKVLLIHSLSGINKIYPPADYPTFNANIQPKDMPELLQFLDTVYMIGNYERSLSLSRELGNDAAARYFEGMSLLRLNRLEEAAVALTKIQKDDKFYPYARIALVQIEIMRQRLGNNTVEENLREILSLPTINEELSERIHILLGQILFEKRLFADALNEFLKVPYKGRFYREAALGQIWSLIKLDSCGDTIPLLKEIKSSAFYDDIEQDAAIIEGHCYFNLGEVKKAADHFLILSKAYMASQERLEQLINDKSLRNRYTNLLLEETTALLTKEEQYYLAELRSAPDISVQLEEHKFLNTLKNGFVEKEKDIVDKGIYTENTTQGLKEILRKRGEDFGRLKNLILAVRKAEQNTVKQPFMMKTDKDFFASTEERIVAQWPKILNRNITEEEKMMVKLILQEQLTTTECPDSTLICPIMPDVIPHKRKYKVDQTKAAMISLEAIGKDMANIQNGEQIGFEKRFATIRAKINKRIEKNNGTISKLEGLREEVRKYVVATEQGLEKNRARLDNSIVQSFIKIKYDMENFNTRIIAGLDAITHGTKNDKIKPH